MKSILLSVFFTLACLGAMAQRVPDSSVTGSARSTVGIDLDRWHDGNNAAGLGNRIGVFNLNETIVSDQASRYYGFVNAPYCVVQSNWTPYGAGGTFVPWVGQNPDLTNKYAFDSGPTHSRPTVVQLMCYFNGPAGTFSMNWFPNDDNIEPVRQVYVPSVEKQTVTYPIAWQLNCRGGRDSRTCWHTPSQYASKQIEATYHYHKFGNYLNPKTGVKSPIETDTPEQPRIYFPPNNCESMMGLTEGSGQACDTWGW